MHGEYKVPGGKLVVVDLEVRDGRIAEFHLAGDFFLEPDDALDDIDAAVNGLPVETDAAAIAAAVRAALPEGAQLLGFTPESVVLPSELIVRESTTRASRGDATRASSSPTHPTGLTDPTGPTHPTTPRPLGRN